MTLHNIRFDRLEHMEWVLDCMAYLGENNIPQTISAITNELGRYSDKPLLSEPTLVSIRQELFELKVIEPPEGYEDPATWTGQHLLFKVYKERVAPILYAAEASNHVQKVRNDRIVESGFAQYDHTGNLQIDGQDFFRRARELGEESDFLDWIAERSGVDRSKITPEALAQLDLTYTLDTDYEINRYPFRPLLKTVNLNEKQEFKTLLQKFAAWLKQVFKSLRPNR